MSGKDRGKDNDSEKQPFMNNTAGVGKEVSDSSDVDKLLPGERATAFVEEAASGKNIKERDIEVQSEDKTKEQSPVDKTDLESRNGNTSGKLSKPVHNIGS